MLPSHVHCQFTSEWFPRSYGRGLFASVVRSPANPHGAAVTSSALRTRVRRENAWAVVYASLLSSLQRMGRGWSVVAHPDSGRWALPEVIALLALSGVFTFVVAPCRWALRHLAEVCVLTNVRVLCSLRSRFCCPAPRRIISCQTDDDDSPWELAREWGKLGCTYLESANSSLCDSVESLVRRPVVEDWNELPEPSRDASNTGSPSRSTRRRARPFRGGTLSLLCLFCIYGATDARGTTPLRSLLTMSSPVIGSAVKLVDFWGARPLRYADLAPVTKKKYFSAIERFMRWTRGNGLNPVDRTEWGDCLELFINDAFVQNEGRERQRVLEVYCALQRRFPFLRGELKASFVSLRSWNKMVPSRSYLPFSLELMHLTVWVMLKMGWKSTAFQLYYLSMVFCALVNC